MNLDTSKTCEDTDVPTRFVKENAYIFAEFDVLTRFAKENAYIFAEFQHSRSNESVKNSKFPYVLKQANVTPVFKKGEKEFKNDSRSVSILSNVSKVFERCA